MNGSISRVNDEKEENEELANLIKIAYKKLKSNIYYDKTLNILRDRIVQFEANLDFLEGYDKIGEFIGIEQDSKINFFNNYLELLAEYLYDDEKFNQLESKIIEKIKHHSFPKNINQNNPDGFITNVYNKNNVISSLQYYIDMPIEGHLFGVLWILLLGFKVDEMVFEQSYGNRLRKKLFKDGNKPTFSPYLFEPYFQQYESWRDNGLNKALDNLNDGKDVVIITMDFKRFFYTVDMDDHAFEELYKDAFNGIKEEEIENIDLLKRLNSFVCNVIKKYSSLFNEEFKNRKVLPIGFLPSNIISNWCLRNFDKAIINGWNPLYYGRYVDDILVVDKVEQNSDIYIKMQSNNLSKEEIIRFYLQQDIRWNGLNKGKLKLVKFAPLLVKRKNSYYVNKLYNPICNDKSKLELQNDKLKVFYFKSGESDALIKCFKDKISKNRSEFRHMPEEEFLLDDDNFEGIYSLKNYDTINKFRGIEKIDLDRFELSKYLGKILRISGLINDNKEYRFAKDVLKIFNYKAIIEHYTFWEKVIEILVINENFDTLKLFIDKTVESIRSINIDKKLFDDNNNDVLLNIKVSLINYLQSGLCRSFSLIIGEEIDNKFFSVLDKVLTSKIEFEYDIIFGPDIKNRDAFIEDKFRSVYDTYKSNALTLRTNYLNTKMMDKYVMPIFIDMININNIFNTYMKLKLIVNLSKFEDVSRFVFDEFHSKYEYYYYPYLVNMYDLSVIALLERVKNCIVTKESFDESILESKLFKIKLIDAHLMQLKRYLKLNYLKQEDDDYFIDLKNKIFSHPFNEAPNIIFNSIENGKKDSIKVAIANLRLSEDNLINVLTGKLDRSYKRYLDTAKVINEAINAEADILVFPEAFLPREWINQVARIAAKNDLAIITGIEHFIVKDKVFNYTAVILPFNDDDYPTSTVYFHLKNHYSPREKELIRGYKLREVQGKFYELYKWYGVYFPVYCCFELASINDRSIFFSYADLIVAVEWNKDVNYYSSIIESLSRDMHCYCVQVNSSDYGDSRITKPSKTEVKDIIRTKGGQNPCVLVDEIDIKSLRDFQLKEYNLQSQDNRFKPTPPEYDKKIVEKRIKGEIEKDWYEDTESADTEDVEEDYPFYTSS